MSILFKLLLLSIVCLLNLQLVVSDSNWDGEDSLDSKGKLKWKLEGNNIRMRYEVETQGWIALGWGATDNGMQNSDMVILKKGKNGYEVGDYFATGYKTPQLDAHQDISTIAAGQSNGITYMEFTRPLDTGDSEKDRPILMGDDFPIVWGYHSSNIGQLQIHTSKGDGNITIKKREVSPQTESDKHDEESKPMETDMHGHDEEVKDHAENIPTQDHNEETHSQNEKIQNTGETQDHNEETHNQNEKTNSDETQIHSEEPKILREEVKVHSDETQPVNTGESKEKKHGRKNKHQRKKAGQEQKVVPVKEIEPEVKEVHDAELPILADQAQDNTQLIESSPHDTEDHGKDGQDRETTWDQPQDREITRDQPQDRETTWDQPQNRETSWHQGNDEAQDRETSWDQPQDRETSWDRPQDGETTRDQPQNRETSWDRPQDGETTRDQPQNRETSWNQPQDGDTTRDQPQDRDGDQSRSKSPRRQRLTRANRETDEEPSRVRRQNYYAETDVVDHSNRRQPKTPYLPILFVPFTKSKYSHSINKRLAIPKSYSQYNTPKRTNPRHITPKHITPRQTRKLERVPASWRY